MKDDEVSPSKKNVKFKMEENRVKEFYKNEKIMNTRNAPAAEDKKQNKSKKGKKNQ